MNGGIGLSDLNTELATLEDLIENLAQTGERTVNSGEVDSQANEVWDYSGTGTQLHVIDLKTGGEDFYVANSNLTIKADAGDSIIFRVPDTHTMEVSESNLLLDGGIGNNNVLFYVDADDGEESFSFNNVTFFGMSMWDLDPDDFNVHNFSNVQFCGQLINDAIDFDNVSGSGCSLDVSSVPLPASVWLFISGLAGFFGFSRVSRKKK